MDSFDYKDEAIQPRRDAATIVWNVLTAIILIVALCVGSIFLVVFINPNISFNPFPPPTLPALISFPTATPTPRITLPPTWTPTITPEATLTSTPEPTFPPTLTATPPQLPGVSPVVSPQLTATQVAGMPFVLQQGSPVAIANIGHPEQGCNWTGVAGRVNNMSNAPIAQGLFIQLGGSLNGQPVDMLSMTGTANQYGVGGYEFALGDKPIASSQMLWVQLFDQAMIPLSDQVYFDTFAECDKNLVLINFSQVR